MITFTIALFLVLISQGSCDDPLFVGLNTVEMIEAYGFPCENHDITTEDGYILTFQRVPHGTIDFPTPRPPVLLMHGMTSSSADFVNRGQIRSLALDLANNGMDVWIGNARGNAWSRKHTTLNVTTEPEQFLDFSWHEIGHYDLPAAIDYILEVNGQDRLFYIGHSQGCTAFLVMGATRPEYNDKVILASLMGPAAFMEHQTNLFLTTVGKYVYEIEDMLWKYQIYELPEPKVLQAIAGSICGNPDNYKFCESMLYMFDGNDTTQFDDNLFPVIFSNLPSNTAMKQFLHYGQLIKNGGFRQYDHGTEKNLLVYGSETPPDYDLSLITAPVALYYGQNDGAVKVEDVKTLLGKLPNVASDYLVPYEYFNHLDFLFAEDVHQVYAVITELMVEYYNN